LIYATLPSGPSFEFGGGVAAARGKFSGWRLGDWVRAALFVFWWPGASRTNPPSIFGLILIQLFDLFLLGFLCSAYDNILLLFDLDMLPIYNHLSDITHDLEQKVFI
jgi:hypothetical protein